MSSEVKERPIVAELSALEGAITGLEGRYLFLKVKPQCT